MVSIASHADDPDRVLGSLVPLLYAFEQNALDLPVKNRLGDDLDSACLETVALIRGYDRFVADRQVIPTFLPERALDAVRDARCAIELGDIDATNDPRVRLGALLAASGTTIVPTHILARMRGLLPNVDRVLRKVRDLRPSQAADAVRGWIGRAGETDWVVAQDKGARVARPRVVALGTIVDGILATDEMNTKGFALSVEKLHAAVSFIRHRPFIGQNHDRTLPPGLIVIDARVCCEDEAGTPRHKLCARIAAISDAGEAQLRRGGGFSIAFHILD